MAKTRNKTRDAFFVDEAITEAYFIVTELILTTYDGIMEKFPDPEERFKFYRMTVGYGLKAYFAYRRLSTLGYLKAKGIQTYHISFEENYVGREDKSALIALMLEEATRTIMEKVVLQFYLMGNSWEVIASKAGISERKVKRVMRRIKRRLKGKEETIEE